MAVIRWWSTPSPRLWHRSFGIHMVVWTTIILAYSTCTFRQTHPAENSFLIPKKIWQIWIHPTQQPSRDWRASSHTWIDLNPDWDCQYAIMNDSSAGAYVQEALKHRQDVVDAFTLANETIHKADFLRYLLLLEEGGVYSDLDTRCAKPIQDWIAPQYRNNTGLVIGIELNDYFEDHYDPERPYIQLCQWTIMARPHHPTMQKVVDSVIGRLQSWEAEDVMEITGPRVFTEAVFESLSELTGRGNEILRDEVSDATKPYQIGDVLILPINAFGSGQSHSGSKKPDECDPFVVHSFAGSWRPGTKT